MIRSISLSYLFYEFDLLLIFYLNEEESLIIRILFYNFFFANIIYSFIILDWLLRLNFTLIRNIKFEFNIIYLFIYRYHFYHFILSLKLFLSVKTISWHRGKRAIFVEKKNEGARFDEQESIVV